MVGITKVEGCDQLVGETNVKGCHQFVWYKIYVRVSLCIFFIKWVGRLNYLRVCHQLVGETNAKVCHQLVGKTNAEVCHQSVGKTNVKVCHQFVWYKLYVSVSLFSF